MEQIGTQSPDIVPTDNAACPALISRSRKTHPSAQICTARTRPHER